MAEPIDVESLAAITANVLDANYDSGAISRGMAYAKEGRVEIIKSAPAVLTSVVNGSGRNAYLVSITWHSDNGWITIEDSCTCPLQSMCKHAVATILTAQSNEKSALQSRALQSNTAVQDGGIPWRQVLGGLKDDPQYGDQGAYTQLGLQFTIVQPQSHRFAPEQKPYIRIQPVRMGKRDKWVKTGATWRDLHYSSTRTGMNPDQIAALLGLWNASPRHSYYPDSGPISLNLFGPDMWTHLRGLLDAGVALVMPNSSNEVLLTEGRAFVEVDLTADSEHNVTVKANVQIDAAPLAESYRQIGFLGSRPHGIFIETDAGDLGLIQLDKILEPAMQRLVQSPPLHIPASEVDEFLEMYQPRLARRARVGSPDGSVSIAHRQFEGLALQIERPAIDVVQTTWLARYRRGSTVSSYGLSTHEGLPRDWESEGLACGKLNIPESFSPLLLSPSGYPQTATHRGSDAVKIMSEVVPWLVDQDRITLELIEPEDAALPDLREASSDPLIAFDVSDNPKASDQTDWFDLALNVSVDGEDIPFASLFAALSSDDPVLVLPSGTWLRIDRPEFQKLRTLIEEARGLADSDTEDDTLRLNKYQVSWFEELAALGVVSAQSERWKDNVARMGALVAPTSCDPPKSLQAELRPYQAEGLAWLAFIQENELGGILADDMGLGKTVQILSLCARVLESKPNARFLVVAPTSVVDNWRREAEQFVPTLPVKTISETQKRRGTPLDDAISGASMVVTSYTLFRLEEDDYTSLNWDMLLLDEAQFVKNYQGKTYRAVRSLDARTKIAISGTPLENSLMDLWSLLSIVAPGLYPDPKRFSSVYRKPIEKGDAPELLNTLRQRIAPLMRRRTKQEVLSELPPKIEQVIEIELNPRHRRIYQTRLQRERAKVLGLVDDVQRNRFVIFKSLMLLRQLSLDPGLVDESDDHIGSAKLDRLVEDVTQIVAEGHRALVFSQFTRYLRRAETRLGAAGVTTVYLDGQTRRRAEVIDAFKSGSASVFLISLKAGGVGLNLMEADYCFILDPWWNPATETQAVDRAHRIGQKNAVMVYRYVAKDTIEEKVMELKARKAALFADVINANGALSGALTEDDIRGLFDAR